MDGRANIILSDSPEPPVQSPIPEIVRLSANIAQPHSQAAWVSPLYPWLAPVDA